MDTVIVINFKCLIGIILLIEFTNGFISTKGVRPYYDIIGWRLHRIAESELLSLTKPTYSNIIMTSTDSSNTGSMETRLTTIPAPTTPLVEVPLTAYTTTTISTTLGTTTTKQTSKNSPSTSRVPITTNKNPTVTTFHSNDNQLTNPNGLITASSNEEKKSNRKIKLDMSNPYFKKIRSLKLLNLFYFQRKNVHRSACPAL